MGAKSSKAGIVKYTTLQDSRILASVEAAVPVTNTSELLCNQHTGYGGCPDCHSFPGLKAPIRRTIGQTAQESTGGAVLPQTLRNKGRHSTLETSDPVPSPGLIQCLSYLFC